jgi:asparagine synthase (glutamine-hydrolysing)
MCGIAGFFDADASFLSNEEQYQILLAKMGRTLKHRGPDASGTLLCNRCGLAHRRLSIIDITGGAQPMSKIYSDYHYHIVYNGEIYNTDDLRHKLTTLGVHFKTTSDTEVLLLGFIHFGPSFIQDVDGIFALAVYDERHETLTLFRDCFGVKPLFYTQTGNTFVFASELKGLFCYPGIAPAVDSNGLNEIFSLGPAHTPGCGVYKNVHEVLPGSYLSVSRAGVRETTYFRLESHPHEDSYETTIATVRELLTGAIRRQMISDVPICTFLSGGIDSSLVSSVCAGELKKEGRQLKTFSFDFTDNENYFQSNSFQPSMDKPYAAKMASYLNSHHTYLECTNQTQADYLLRSVKAHDLPCMADIDSSLLYFCEQVSHTHKVVLTGECADEVFGGYPWFHRESMLDCGTFPWTPTLAPRKSLLNADFANTLRMEDYVKNAYDRAVSEVDILPMENETETSRRRIGYLSIRFFMQTLLNRMDRTSMNTGLEARVPFADKQLVSYVFNIPWEMKAKGGLVKNILRRMKFCSAKKVRIPKPTIRTMRICCLPA